MYFNPFVSDKNENFREFLSLTQKTSLSFFIFTNSAFNFSPKFHHVLSFHRVLESKVT